MIAAMTKMTKSVNGLGDIQVLTDDDWVRLSHIQELLAPFEEATKKFSSSTTCSLSFASFALERLEGFLKKHIKKDHFKELGIEAMLEKLLKYKGEIDSSFLPRPEVQRPHDRQLQDQCH